MEENCGVPYELELRVRVGEYEKVSRLFRTIDTEEDLAEGLRLQADKASEMLVTCYRAIMARRLAHDFIK